MAKKKKAGHGAQVFTSILIGLIITLILATGVLIWLCLNLSTGKSVPSLSIPAATTAPTLPEETEPEETEPPTTLPPEPEHVVATATIGATGDILMHLPVVNTGLQSDGSYNFDCTFRYLKPFSESVDYAIANLETTLAGTDNGYKYSGFPMFNCPDEIVDAMRDSGFDMLLTANNHCYDTSTVGLLRTIEVTKGKGLDVLGTYATAEEKQYSVVDINGIKVGMFCYTYETPVPQNGYAGRTYLNGLALKKGDEQLVASFLPSNLNAFYSEVETALAEMKDAGAEATVMFIHWGEEYLLTPVPYQKTVAQKLCDMGFDVIVGGHPHVVEPIELLTSTEDENHKTVCLYSMGNAVSNQRLGNISRVSSAHTEDGVWFTFTFSKYSDDTVYLESVDLIPTWVDLRTTGHREYDIIPLDLERQEEWQSVYELSDAGYSAAKRSYDRTWAIIGAGLEESQVWLAEQKDLREANYLAAVMELIAGK